MPGEYTTKEKAAETVATEQTTNAADAAKIEESAAAATTNALVKIEG